MKKILLMCFILFIAFTMVGCDLSEKQPDIKEYLNEIWNIQLPDTTEQIYGYYEPTFTGMAYQYAVLTCDEVAINELTTNYEFHLKDDSSTQRLNDFFKYMADNKKRPIDKTYFIDLSENYTYYLQNNIVWLALNENRTKLSVCIVGH